MDDLAEDYRHHQGDDQGQGRPHPVPERDRAHREDQLPARAQGREYVAAPNGYGRLGEVEDPRRQVDRDQADRDAEMGRSLSVVLAPGEMKKTANS